MDEHVPIPKEWNLNYTGILAFSGSVAQQSELMFYVQRSNLEQLWKMGLELGAHHGASNFMHFIIGDHGLGKTISLLRINDIVLSDYKSRLLPIFLSFVAEDTLRPRDFLLRLLASIDYAGLAKQIKSSELKQAVDRIPPDFEGSYSLMKNLLLPQRSLATTETFFPERQWTQTIADETYEAANRYFLGQSVTQRELRLLGVSHKLDSAETAWKHLTAIRWVLGGLGYSAIIMLVDEFEYLFSLVSRNKRPQYVALLRQIVDASPSSPDMTALDSFFAVSNGGWKQLMDLAEYETTSAGPTQALRRRIDNTTLSNLTPQQTRGLIEKRLQFGRVHAADPGEECNPFTNDFIEFVQHQSMGVPGEVVSICLSVLKAGLSCQVAQLDKKFAIQALDERA